MVYYPRFYRKCKLSGNDYFELKELYWNITNYSIVLKCKAEYRSYQFNVTLNHNLDIEQRKQLMHYLCTPNNINVGRKIKMGNLLNEEEINIVKNEFMTYYDSNSLTFFIESRLLKLVATCKTEKIVGTICFAWEDRSFIDEIQRIAYNAILNNNFSDIEINYPILFDIKCNYGLECEFSDILKKIIQERIKNDLKIKLTNSGYSPQSLGMFQFLSEPYLNDTQTTFEILLAQAWMFIKDNEELNFQKWLSQNTENFQSNMTLSDEENQNIDEILDRMLFYLADYYAPIKIHLSILENIALLLLDFNNNNVRLKIFIKLAKVWEVALELFQSNFMKQSIAIDPINPARWLDSQQAFIKVLTTRTRYDKDYELQFIYKIIGQSIARISALLLDRTLDHTEEIVNKLRYLANHDFDLSKFRDCYLQFRAEYQLNAYSLYLVLKKLIEDTTEDFAIIRGVLVLISYEPSLEGKTLGIRIIEQMVSRAHNPNITDIILNGDITDSDEQIVEGLNYYLSESIRDIRVFCIMTLSRLITHPNGFISTWARNELQNIFFNGNGWEVGFIEKLIDQDKLIELMF